MSVTARSKRLFFALWPQGKVRERLQETRTMFCPRDGRWTSPENLHVTLVFLGNVATQKIPSIEEAVSQINVNAFAMQLDWLRSGPSRGMVSLMPRFVPNELLDLVSALKSSLAALDFHLEERVYRPHVTLIRRLPGRLGQRQIDPVHWPIKSFSLVESSHSRGVSIYTRSKIWRLRK